MSRARGVLIVLLVILAASPVTAPFSTCDLFELFSDLDVPPAAAVVKAAPSKDLSMLPADGSQSAVQARQGEAPVHVLRTAPGYTPHRPLPLRL